MRWESGLTDRLNSIPVTALEVVSTPPLLKISGSTSLSIGEVGTWTMTFLLDESPVGDGSNINIYDQDGQLVQYMFATIDEGHRSVVAQHSFAQAGVYTIKPYQDWNTGFGPFRITVTQGEGVETESEELKAGAIQLEANPNPFNPSTILKFCLVHPGQAQIVIYNLRGQQIAHVAEGVLTAGWHTVKWQASDIAGGIYICTLYSGGTALSKKLLLLK